MILICKPKDALCQLWLKLALWFWRRRVLKFDNVFSPLGKGRGHSVEQTWIPISQGCFVPNLVEIGPVVLEKKMKMLKVNKQTTDNRRSEKLAWVFSSGEHKGSLYTGSRAKSKQQCSCLYHICSVPYLCVSMAFVIVKFMSGVNTNLRPLIRSHNYDCHTNEQCSVRESN